MQETTTSPSKTQGDSTDLRVRLEFLTRYGWVVIVVALSAVNCAYWLTTRQTPIYETSSAVLLRTTGATTRAELSKATKLLRSNGSPVFGVVVNGDRGKAYRYDFSSAE